MNQNKIRNRLAYCKRQIERRLDKRDNTGAERPMLTATNIHYELSDRVQATGAGGIGLIHQMTVRLGLDEAINRDLHLLKFHFPYHESDHVLNIAYNVMAGGRCLEHLEYRRTDASYLDGLGARRIPDPTTAGDFCRRFAVADVQQLMATINGVRQKVWQEQDDSFFEEAILDADGTMAETTGELKDGMDINYKGQWGYHPLVISLANTGEPLYLVNRPGNRPSHEQAAAYLDQAIDVCKEAGFQRILLRGDTDFTQTGHLDRWDEDGVRFVFGIDAMSNLYDIAEELPESDWKLFDRHPRYEVETEPRRRRQNVKEEIVRERQFENIGLCSEHVAEFRYSPTLCNKEYRVVVLWKSLEVTKGQQFLFDDARAFFYITNDWDSPAEEIVRQAHGRCNQENLIEQLKNGVRAIGAPLDNLVSNWAYMVMAGLAWSLKAWASLLVPVTGRWQEKHTEQKEKLLRMDFATFRQAMISIPAQIVRTGRRLVYRFLAWNPWQPVFFRLLDRLRQPLRC